MPKQFKSIRVTTVKVGDKTIRIHWDAEPRSAIDQREVEAALGATMDEMYAGLPEKYRARLGRPPEPFEIVEVAPENKHHVN